MHRKIRSPHLLAATLWIVPCLCPAIPSAPSAITPRPSDTGNHVTLSWSAVASATSYHVKRSVSPASTLTTIGSTTATTFTDSTALPGVIYYYTITANDPDGESPPTRGVLASASVVVDNGNTGTSSTGSWSASSVAGYYGTAPVFAGPTSGSTPTATYTFTPDLPARGNYDIYMRWTTNPNRATNTPVDLVFPDGIRTVTVDQELDNGVWMLLTNIAAETGTTASVIIRNNGANGNVIADAVQFVPRHSPVAADSEKLSEYTLLAVDENFDGTTLNTSLWSTFLGRGEHSISGGRLHTKLRYKGSVPIDSATVTDLETEANWTEGGIVADQAQKFGYHEARLRLPQLPASGVDTAYWHGATDELLHGYEIDAPEFFNKDADGSSNSYGFGVWDHVLPTRARPGLTTGRTWNYGANYSTLGDTDQYVTVGLEWRTDNSHVIYINGKKIHSAPTSGMNDVESILPSNIILSTKVLDWAHPNAALDGAEATWDYARYYQKPGFLGTVDGDWATPENWGPDGKPAPGYAAVFNMSTAPAAIALPTDQELQSLFLDGAALPAHNFSGPGALRLGAAKSGDDSVTHGGILVNTTVANNQTFSNPVIGLQNLQFANLSRSAGVTLFLNGPITGDGLALRDVDFISLITAATPSTGAISLSQPLGTGIRHISRAGDISFSLPANSQHTGELRIARGPVVIPEISSLGTTPDSAVEFGPRYQHSDSWRPRLTYTGTAGTSAHPIRLGGWQADGVIESSGTGPLTWSGDVLVAPYASDATRALTRTPRFTLGGSNTGENTLSGTISDAGVIVTWKNADGSDNTGPALLSINKTGAGTWALGGNNAYSGTTSLGGGTLVVTSLNSVNGGAPLLPASSLGTPKTVNDGTITITSGTLKYTGTGETTDRVISLAGSSGATIDHRGTGLLKFTSDFISSTSTKTLTLTGSGTGEIAAVIPNNSSTNKTNVVKSGAGTWRLSGANTYTGTTTVSAGMLVVDGSIATGGNLTVSSGTATLTGSGIIATPATVSGTLVASPLTFTNTLTLGSTGKFTANFNGNNSASIASLIGATVTITSGAKVDVSLNTPGSTTNFIQSYWRSPRSWRLLSATQMTGSFALGTISADAGGRPALTYGSFSLQQSATGVTLNWTPLGGFPNIDDPAVSRVNPVASPVAVQDLAHALRVAVSAMGGGNMTYLWSQTSGPGTTTFSSNILADTIATFSAAGRYVLRCTATNEVGNGFTEFIVDVAPPQSVSLRQGVNGYEHRATMIRADNTAWNSGARDQILVGKANNSMRAIFSFDLETVPRTWSPSAVTLDLWTAAATSGAVGNLSLRQLTRNFIEGSGDGVTSTSGAGTGATWATYNGSTSWTTAGGDYQTAADDPSIASFSEAASGAQKTFPSTPVFLSSLNAAISTSSSLNLIAVSSTETGTTNIYARFASDDHATEALRPRLNIQFSHNFAPTVNPGPAPAAQTGIAANLSGTVSNATSTTWSLVSGPGTATYGNSNSPSTTVIFSQPGNYLLRFSASNANGEASRNLSVTAVGTDSSTFSGWQAATWPGISDTNIIGDYADPDHDGVNNLLEWALHLDPNKADVFAPVLAISGNTLKYTYTRRKTAPGEAAYQVVWSDTLGNDWSSSGVSGETIVSATPTSEEIKVSVPLGNGMRFLRLKVSRS